MPAHQINDGTCELRRKGSCRKSGHPRKDDPTNKTILGGHPRKDDPTNWASLCSVLLGDEESVVRASAAWQNEMIAGYTKGFVPRSCKAREKLFDSASADLDAWVNHFPPGSDVGSFLRFLKSDPLGEGDADGVVDPPHFLSRDACGNYVVDDGIYGPQDLDLE